MISNEKDDIVIVAMGDVVMIFDSKALDTTYQYVDVVKRRIQNSLK